MRIAIDGRVVRDRFPGIGRYVHHLVRALDELGSGLRLLLLHSGADLDSRFDLDLLAQSPAIDLVPISAGLADPRSQWEVRRALHRFDAQVFHATYWLTSYWPGVPCVLSVYDLIGLRQPGAVSKYKRLALLLSLRLAARSADQLITLSQSSERDVVASGLADGKPVTVTPLAPGPEFVPASAAAIDELRKRLSLPQRYVLYVGSNKPHKNLPLLVEAWSLANCRHDTALSGPSGEKTWLVLAGSWDGRYYPTRLQPSDRTQFEPQSDNVLLLGSVGERDLPALYSGAAAFAFPSLYEGFGLPPLEAMACGVPVVAANATSLPEVVGDAGLLVRPDDPGAWAAALARLLADPAAASELGRRGRARAARFSWSKTAQQTLEAYKRLLQSAHA